MLLAACYDQSTAENAFRRGAGCAASCGFRTWRSKWDLALGIAVTVAVIGVFAWFGSAIGRLHALGPTSLIAAGWAPRLWRLLRWWWRAWRIARNTPRLEPQHEAALPDAAELPRRANRRPAAARLAAHRRPLRTAGQASGRLRSLRFDGILVLVDRVDEPYLINGSVELMRALVWPMLDNKFLKHPGLGLKLLLPIELERFIDRERPRFPSAGPARQAKHDSLAGVDRAIAVRPGRRPDRRLRRRGAIAEALDLFEGVERAPADGRLRTLRVPRHLFKFMYRLFTAHCNSYTEEQPAWKISPATFESVLRAVPQRRGGIRPGARGGVSSASWCEQRTCDGARITSRVPRIARVPRTRHTS